MAINQAGQMGSSVCLVDIKLVPTHPLHQADAHKEMIKILQKNLQAIISE